MKTLYLLWCALLCLLLFRAGRNPEPMIDFAALFFDDSDSGYSTHYGGGYRGWGGGGGYHK